MGAGRDDKGAETETCSSVLQVKEDNQEIATMERQFVFLPLSCSVVCSETKACVLMCVLTCAVRLAEIRERTRQTVEEIQHLEENSEAAQGD